MQARFIIGGKIIPLVGKQWRHLVKRAKERGMRDVQWLFLSPFPPCSDYIAVCVVFRGVVFTERCPGLTESVAGSFCLGMLKPQVQLVLSSEAYSSACFQPNLLCSLAGGI